MSTAGNENGRVPGCLGMSSRTTWSFEENGKPAAQHPLGRFPIDQSQPRLRSPNLNPKYEPWWRYDPGVTRFHVESQNHGYWTLTSNAAACTCPDRLICTKMR